MNDPINRLGLRPEQQDTARLLRELLGNAVASRYEDFCCLSTGLVELNASKPLAAHALRELESIIRGILAVPMEAVARDNQDSANRQKEARIALRKIGFTEGATNRAIDALAPRTNHKDQIRQILTRLGFEAEGDIAKLWIKIVDTCQTAHGRSFHRTLQVDTDFITNLQQPFDTVIRAVVVALRDHYAALMRRVQAIVAMPHRGHAVKLFAKEIPGAMQLQWFFLVA